ncbi:hypothetical protein PRK78_004506 [Emydomyces testavorans]|uniref:Uncharacterized protein n=1 Tax=Emydomyces testavorans TaxID=2070801 RepID=A0AAF0IJA6_9EURO|nr:hypothetical protein PRK78_004506 [Emydomyces testavorans]
MAGFLSALSPLSLSKQNARSPPVDEIAGDHTVSQTITNDPQGSLGKTFTIYDENTSPRNQDQHPSMPVAPLAEEDELCEQGPPSSPFQETVHSEPTSLTRNVTPVRSDVGSIDDNKFDNEDDVNMDQEDPELEEHAMPVMEETHTTDLPISKDEQKIIEFCPDADSSVIHHHVGQAQTRKVSGMTVNNENMSIVYHRDDARETAFEDFMGNNAQLGYDTADDTCLSTFSAVPNADMTLFAKLRTDSPFKRPRDSTMSPRKAASPSRFQDSILETPGTAKRDYRRNGWGDQGSEYGSPMPGRKYARFDETSNLLEFTDQLNGFSHRQYAFENSYASPARRNQRGSPIKAAERLRSPNKLSLLDFDIPPVPTPRSIPTITPRELESLKSSFLTQISSLKATLSGRDAEVASLKEAVSDAERRVGEALEEVRDEAARREALESEQREWERRGKEMESVLRGVKAEIVDGERERKRLADRVEEAEKSKEHLEGKIVELQSQLSAARQAAPQQGTAISPDSQFKTAEEVAKEVQDAVEKVARELHTLYKGKHETKVAALKKSYEARWEKRLREAEKRLKDAKEQNERLKTELDTAMSGVHADISAGDTTIFRETESLEAEKRVLEAKVKGLEQEMLSIKQDNEMLSEQLKNERAEKGELVAVVDEWFAMQQQQQQDSNPPPVPPHAERELSIPRTELSQEDEPMQAPTKIELIEKPAPSQSNENAPPTSNIARFANGPSGIRSRPCAGLTPKVPRFGVPAGHVRGSSRDEKSTSGIPSKTPSAPRSGIMSSIERMGRGGL